MENIEFLPPEDTTNLDSPLLNVSPGHITPYGNHEIIHFEDESVLFREKLIEEGKEIDPNNFDQNLADVIDKIGLDKIGAELQDLIEEDEESQEPYLLAVSEILRIAGYSINDDTEDSLPFPNASNIHSMAFNEALNTLECIVYSSLFPASGLTTTQISGFQSPELEETAEKIKAFANLFFANISIEFKPEIKRTWKWALTTGCGAKKVFIDPILNRPTSVFILPQDFIVNRQYTTQRTALRKTHRIYMTYEDIQARIMSGRYKNINFEQEGNENPEDSSQIMQQLRQISGVNESESENVLDINRIYAVDETHLMYNIAIDPLNNDPSILAPYIITRIANSAKILDIRRNWKPYDPFKKPIEYFVTYSPFTSFDGEGYGLLHTSGNNAKNATAILRQSCNTTIYANFPGGWYTGGTRTDKNFINPAPGTWSHIDTGGVSLKDAIMPLPYREAGPVMLELLQKIEATVQKPAAILTQDMMSAATSAPMGTMLWIFENMQKTPNAILETFYDSLAHELSLFKERFAEWIPPAGYSFKVLGGELVITAQDFQNDIKLIPAASPSFQNSSFKFLQAQTLLENARQSPELHDMRVAYENFYNNLGVPKAEIEKLLLPPAQQQQPFSGDPVTENSLFITGKPVTATIMQNHEAHEIVHQAILQNPNTPPQVAAAVQAHLQEHEAFKYVINMQMAMGIQMPSDPSQISPEEQNQIAVMAAQVIQNQQQQAIEQNPPPLDPVAVQLEIEKMKAERAMEEARIKYESELMRLQMEQDKFQTERDISYKKLEVELIKNETQKEIENKKIDLDLYHKENKRVSEQLQKSGIFKPLDR